MQQVNIKEVKPGMVLAQEVCGSNGRMLLGKGVTIEDKHLRIMNMWGVSEIFIHNGPEDPGEPQIDAAHLLAAEERVASRFVLENPEQEPLPELRKQCVSNYAQRFSQNWSPASWLNYPPQDTLKGCHIPTLTELTSIECGLVSLPDIFYRINDALDSPSCTASHLADIISKDSGLSARLLRLVNSPALNPGRTVDSLARGVVILGMKEISQLALGVTVLASFKNQALHHFPMVEFWKHSLSCAVFARLLAIRLENKNSELFFLAGLLHDVGRLLLLHLAPQAAGLALSKAHEERIPSWAAEQAVFGYNHSDVAKTLMERWRLPASLVQLIAGHHAPKESQEPQGSAVLTVADAMSNALEYGTNGQYYFTGMAEGAWELLQCSPSVLAVIIGQAQRQLEDIYTAFLG